MKHTIALTLCIVFIMAFVPTATAAETFAEGAYTIRSQNGLYLAKINGKLGCSGTNKDYVWHIRDAGGGAFFVYAEDLLNNELLDLNNDWDIEGNTVGIFRYTGYLAAQTWLFVPNSDGSYQIRTVHDSGRVITENGAQQPTIQTYTGAATQKWTFTSVAGDNDYTMFMNVVIETTKNEIITHIAKNETDASLKKLITTNADKHNMVEGEYVVLHLPNSIWAKYSDPKKLIDAYDSIYRAQQELTGGKTKPYTGKLYFLTDHNPKAPYMYASGDLCASNLSAVENNANFWTSGDRINALWGVGHEIGHAMVNTGMGRIFEGYDGESWNNVLNVYSLGQLGLYNEARQWVNQYPGNYGYSNDKYIQFKGRDYDELNDDERISDILAVNTHIFVKLPMLLVDNYGWDGMRKFFTKAAEDRAGGMSASSNIQDRIDYMVVNLSKAYNMDLSMLFDYWRVSPSASAKQKIADLPIERIIAASYSLPLNSALPFTDVLTNAWYCDDVKTAWEMGLINGKTATLFAPEDNLTYAEAIKLAACMHQLYTTGKITLTNGSPNWYDSYVTYAKNNGIINKDYSWNTPATRAGYMEIFADTLPDSALAAINTIPDGSIPDVPMTHPQAAAIYKLYRAGILQGAGAAHNCNPGSNIRRSEVAAILTRMMNNSTRVSFTM